MTALFLATRPDGAVMIVSCPSAGRQASDAGWGTARGGGMDVLAMP